MHKKSECVSVQETKQPDSPTIKYLLKKNDQQLRKSSVESDFEKPNFCCNYDSENYKVMRVYMNSLTSKFVQLYYTKFTPQKKQGQICIIHGYAETSNDYLQMAQYYCKIGYVVHMIDLRGIGYSGGLRANQPIKEVLSDIENLLRRCCQHGLETFIIAHGLGAMFVNSLLQENPNLPISGVIFLSPIVNFINPNKNSLLHRIVSKLNLSIFDDLQISSGINPTALSKNPSHLKKKIESFFNVQMMTLKMARQYSKIGEKVREQAYKFCYPLLICRGGKDYIQEQIPLRQFFVSCSSYDKEFKVFDEGYHEFHNDIQGQEVKEYIQNWMIDRRKVGKEKIKWKNVQPFNLDFILKKKVFAKFILFMISFLLGLISFLKRCKKFI